MSAAPAGASSGTLFAGGGEMGALMRSTDWSRTRLGPVEQWQKSLRTMLGVVLGSRFPMLLWWGPDLLHLYNDAYRPILRDKHPASLAAPAAEVWAEVWDFAGPLARGVMGGGPATWMEDVQLFIRSGDLAEETHFTFSYSPVPGDDGRIGGVLNTVQETSAKVQGERQIRMLRDLAARASEARSESEAYRVTSEVLATNEIDLPFALLYALDECGQEARLVASTGWDAPPAGPFPVREGEGPWPFAEVLRTGLDVVVEGLSTRFGPLPLGRWNGRPERAIVLALPHAVKGERGVFLVLGVSPHRVLDERYRELFRATTDQLAGILAGARAYEAATELAETRAQLIGELEQRHCELQGAFRDLKATQAQLVQSAKMASLGALVAGIAHEINNPLSFSLSHLETARRSLTRAEEAAHQALFEDARAHRERAQERLLEMTLGLERIRDLVLKLRTFSRLDEGDHHSVSVRAAIESVLVILQHRLRGRITVEQLLEAPDELECYPALLNQALLNLVSNAIDAIDGPGKVTISTVVDGESYRIAVADTGAGIPAELRERVFEPFFTTKPVGKGTGLGLSITYSIVQKHGGALLLESAQGGGTIMTMSLPLPTGASS